MAQQLKSQKKKEKIINSSIKLFAEHGFEATTTRMIANDAEVSLSAIAFYFETKENLYKETLSIVAERISLSYEEINQKIEILYQDYIIKPDDAWDIICEMIDLQIDISIDRKSPEYISLLHCEQTHNIDNYTPITATIIAKSENTLSKLIMAYTQNTNFKLAAIISRTVIGGIISFTEHAMYTENILSYGEVKSDKTWLKKILRDFVLSSIKNIKNL